MALTRRREAPMKWRHPILLFVGLCWSVWGFLYSGFALSGERSLEKSFP